MISRTSPPHLSPPRTTVQRMRTFLDGSDQRRETELIASFGGAENVKHLDGKLEIRGGTEQEETQAHAWMKQFLTQGPLTVRRVR